MLEPDPRHLISDQPDSAAESKISDYFDMAFTTLPHKLLQPDQFALGIKDLRKRFVDPKDPDYAFKSSYHKRIPADGCAPYMAGIWVRPSTAC